MSKKRITVTLANSVIDAIDATGKEIWTDLEGNRSALIGKIVGEFTRGRSENGGKTARVERQVKELRQEVAQLSERMAALEQMVRKIYQRGNHDTDHA